MYTWFAFLESLVIDCRHSLAFLAVSFCCEINSLNGRLLQANGEFLQKVSLAVERRDRAVVHHTVLYN
jgi:hypothetical protein